MPAEYVFAGGRLDSVVNILGVVTESTATTVRDVNYADVALVCGPTSAFAAEFVTATAGVLSPTTIVSGESLWLHFEINVGGSPATTNGIWVLYDSSGFPWFRVSSASTNLFQWQYNSGTGASPVWTNVGSTWASISATLYQMDLRVTLGSPHTFDWYVNGTSVSSGSFTQALFTNLAKASFTGTTGAAATNYSQFLASRDIPTIGSKVRYSRPTANGTNTAWSGVFTDVNEAIGNDVTLNSSASAGQRETHAMGDVTVPAGYLLPTVFHWMRAKNDGAAPANIKSVLRSGGTDYSTGNLSGVGLGFAAVGARYDTDPATAAAWNQTGFNALEAGYESAT